jgi:hypothetical protein
VDTLGLKLVVTPALIGAASLAGRRWGPAVSGWLVGLPLTSGPVAFFLALDHGASFAAAAAAGSLAGTIAEAVFCVAYARVAPHASWIAAGAAGTVAFAAAMLLLQRAPLGIGWFFVAGVLALTAALALIPRGSGGRPAAPLPRWDLPARIVVATALVLGLTAAAPVLGARLSGLLSTFPIYAGILTVFAHRIEGSGSAIQVLRGLLLGLFAFATFFLVLGAVIERLGVAAAFILAIAAALALHAAALRVVMAPARRPGSA